MVNFCRVESPSSWLYGLVLTTRNIIETLHDESPHFDSFTDSVRVIKCRDWALSVIPRRSWGDVARRFTMVRWIDQKMCFLIHNELEKENTQQKLFSKISPSPPLPPPAAPPSSPPPFNFAAIVPTRRFFSRKLHWGSSALQ
ncbi:hypothetical protein F511_08956 [Dorcoceras hygrometricum]|uniref:Uncharacterized protein n=1 Tax=Dorcoceras hygrometricum TaxID=472368 RepID=A0A2Z7CTC5_9LAMI|nr:hypothetical protein F511_08956 [Dorcoceras hygrometricum]